MRQVPSLESIRFLRVENAEGSGISEAIQQIYTDRYEGGAERAWRDAGACDKAANIERAWRFTGESERPRIVELGCGEGAVAAALARHDFFADFRGYDISPSGIEEASARNVPLASFTTSDRFLRNIDSNSADLVVLSHVVEHLEHPRELLYQAHRLAPWTIIEVPTELNIGAPKDYVVDSLGHINKYNALSIRHLVQSCGFEVVTQFTSNPSRDVALFYRNTGRARLKWQTKEAALKVVPPLARHLFTYHETLLARRIPALDMPQPD